MGEIFDMGKELHPGKKGISGEHTCGAVDEREAKILMHLIMAEIRKSNAPVWVNEELQKKFECHGCQDSLRKLPAAKFH